MKGTAIAISVLRDVCGSEPVQLSGVVRSGWPEAAERNVKWCGVLWYFSLRLELSMAGHSTMRLSVLVVGSRQISFWDDMNLEAQPRLGGIHAH
jgi:hypothetical protein